ncbi:cysteine-rich receptor-like protein kinase 44 isoform X2 [Corylus avellana]|uniref:cysteine-rich receptor-like protein kinase 44 isoform X2 n=1 Tax=Corylus avellana TaxID=13451 RepID=UPI00286D4065|nr:cysteine-rich receptor-like protein kinase 44 isoform X2 [Corylus avellana]
MCCSRLLFFFCFILLYPVTLTFAQKDPYVCSTSGNYSSNSTYRANLNSLLASMSSNTEIDYGFYKFSAGEFPNKVNAIALCRGDISTEECRSCVNASSHDLLQYCPNQKEAIIWYSTCMVRYSNKLIFGVMEDNPLLAYYNVQNVSDVEGFNQVLRPLLDRLRNHAASGNSTRKFAAASAAAPDFQTIFALLMCTPDLDELECNSCLRRAIEYIPQCCDGKQGGRYIAPSCDLRYEIYTFYDPAAEEALPPPPSPLSSPPPSLPSVPPFPPTEGKERNSSQSAVIITVPTVASVLLISCIYIFYLRVSRQREKDETVDETSSTESLQFDFSTIKVATEDFSIANKLGEGGFGAVYKGRLPNGQEIAVKMLSRESGQGTQEFNNEVLLVAMLQHRNLVKLLGFCLEGNEKLLVYEFVPNASLDRFIFDRIKRVQLNWDRRYKIIEGIARGLLYLHEDSRHHIIHRDLKASNILLDEDMNPKISDFGTARLLDQTQGNTKKIIGTYGYMAPEYAMRGYFSVKSDVFSFGVLVLEIICGQKNSSFTEGENVEGLLSYAWKNWREGTTSNLIDRTLRAGPTTQIMRCIHVGLLCVQENVVKRPTMASVVLMLSSYSITLSVPTKPPFLMYSTIGPNLSSQSQNRLEVIKSNPCRSSSVDASINEASITELYPR